MKRNMTRNDSRKIFINLAVRDLTPSTSGLVAQARIQRCCRRGMAIGFTD
jgi:hypothetical protein